MSKKKETNDNLDFRSGMETSDGKSGKGSVKRIVANIAIGVVTLGIPLFFIGRCSKADNGNDNKGNTESVRADSTMQSLWAQNHKMHDALLVAHDSIDVLNTKNDSLQFACDSLKQGWDGCKGGEVVAANNTNKETQTSGNKGNNNSGRNNSNRNGNNNNKPHGDISGTDSKNTTDTNIQDKSADREESKTVESGSTTVNVNTPNNIINISNGGVINNYIEEQKKAEEQYIKEYKCAQDAYKDGFVPTGRRVRCK